MSNQDDLFLPPIVPFPLSAAPVPEPVTEQAHARPELTHMGVGDKIKSVVAQSDGSQYRDGEVIEVSECRRYIKIYARKIGSPYWNCMHTLWVKAEDCTGKGRRRV